MNNTNEQTFRMALRSLEKEISQLQESVLACCSLSFAQCNIIMEIGRAGSVSLKKLAESLEVDSSTMSITVSKMVKHRLLKRETDPDDRRYVSIVLTDEGLEHYEDIKKGMDSYYSTVYSSVPAEKREQMIESMQLLSSILKSIDCCENN